MMVKDQCCKATKITTVPKVKLHQLQPALAEQKRRQRDRGMNIMVANIFLHYNFCYHLDMVIGHLHFICTNIMWRKIYVIVITPIIITSIVITPILISSNCHIDQVGVILVDYVVFTLPGLIVLEVDLNAERNENVGINITIRADKIDTKDTVQAHIPTYILSWLTAIINPIIYVVCNPTYRESAAKKLNCLTSLSRSYKPPKWCYCQMGPNCLFLLCGSMWNVDLRFLHFITPL